MLNLNDVYYFVQVVENKGITAAARALGMAKSSLSRRIHGLETALGARMIQRTSRGFDVTEVGEAFYKHAVAMLIEAEAAENVVRQRMAEPSGIIRFSCSVATAQLLLADLIPKFMIDHPHVRIVQHASNRQVDLLQEGFDLCLRAHVDPLPDSTLVQRVIAQASWHLFAGPDYLRSRGVPDTPADLASHDGIAFGGIQDVSEWRLSHAARPDQVETVPFKALLCSDDMTTLKAAACHGMGIVALPGYVGRSEVGRGQLVRVLPDWIAGRSTISLLMLSRRGLLPSIRTFVDFLAEQVPIAVQC
ncbi:LysR family transcriptional regulator [Burkholderia sp. AU30280]|uniref:LysR substrate-binding domain-containing protein n=1 Tax=Burkholderia sp. AU30280 TaxID=2879628 RepID=UPI001CF5C67A|nr:LysR substrate-binding domain-containing protein [Burkholderia sp. AU30280]MCA8275629.1 LysR family transcriptional regulator [Burkholderia sp. AU30280]